MWAKCRGPVPGSLTTELLVAARSGTAASKLPPSQPSLLPAPQPLETVCAASLGSLPWPWGLSRLLSAQVPRERQALWLCTLRGATHLVVSQPPPCLADFFVRWLGRAPAAPGSLPRYNSPERRRPGKAPARAHQLLCPSCVNCPSPATSDPVSPLQLRQKAPSLASSQDLQTLEGTCRAQHKLALTPSLLESGALS